MKEAKQVNLTVRLVEEHAVQRYQRATYKTTRGRLTDLWDQLEQKTIKTSEFLREIGNMYTVPIPEADEEPIDSDSDDEWNVW